MIDTTRRIALILFCLLLLPSPTAAQEQPWRPTIPEETPFVWIRLPSGEWLAGEVKSLRDKAFEFDSEELDDLSFDWDDIKELRSPQILTLGFEDGSIVTGTATISETTIAVRVGETVREYPRSDLLSIISGRPSEWNYWSAKASVGFVQRSGNTEQTDLNTRVFLRRQTPGTRLDMEYSGNFGETSGERTINNHNGTARFDWLVSQGFFVTPASGSLLKDEFQNISLRWTLGAGVGYFIVREGDVEWSVSAGGGVQQTEYISVEQGQSATRTTGILIPGTKLDMDITGSLDLIAEYAAQVGLSEPKSTFHHTSVFLSLDALGDILEFTVSVTWDHTTHPQPTESGAIPKKNDLRTAFGIGVDF